MNSVSSVGSEAPIWLRLPRPGMKDRLTGLSRSSMNNLVLPSSYNGEQPPVRSVVLRKRGANRGIRLVHRESLLAHLESLTVTSDHP